MFNNKLTFFYFQINSARRNPKSVGCSADVRAAIANGSWVDTEVTFHSNRRFRKAALKSRPANIGLRLSTCNTSEHSFLAFYNFEGGWACLYNRDAARCCKKMAIDSLKSLFQTIYWNDYSIWQVPLTYNTVLSVAIPPELLAAQKYSPSCDFLALRILKSPFSLVNTASAGRFPPGPPNHRRVGAGKPVAEQRNWTTSPSSTVR